MDSALSNRLNTLQYYSPDSLQEYVPPKNPMEAWVAGTEVFNKLRKAYPVTDTVLSLHPAYAVTTGIQDIANGGNVATNLAGMVPLGKSMHAIKTLIQEAKTAKNPKMKRGLNNAALGVVSALGLNTVDRAQAIANPIEYSLGE